MLYDLNNIHVTGMSSPIFEEFDLITGDLSILEIVEKSQGGNCFVRSKDGNHYYGAFILHKNTKTATICEVQFFPSSSTGLYIPRLTFKKVKTNGQDQTCRGEAIRIELNNSDVAQRFWELIGFFGSFKSLVDTGDFERKFKVVSEDYAQIIRQLDTPKKISAIKSLIKNGDFSSDDVKSLVFESRKTTLRLFLWLLKNKILSNGKTSMRDWYKTKYSLHGDEAIWHHFFKNNDWILGLNVDLRFISEFIQEAKVGVEDTSGKRSPKADMLGISNYTTLIELKTSDTPIFKPQRGSNGRANTWEFSAEFISGISQCLGQKSSFDESYCIKSIIREDGTVISKENVYNKDVKTVFIIGMRYAQFPHDEQINNTTKSNTFELFRRNNRNVEIITFDELFERAYHIVFAEKIDKDWFTNNAFDIKTK